MNKSRDVVAGTDDGRRLYIYSACNTILWVAVFRDGFYQNKILSNSRTFARKKPFKKENSKKRCITNWRLSGRTRNDWLGLFRPPNVCRSRCARDRSAAAPPPAAAPSCTSHPRVPSPIHPPPQQRTRRGGSIPRNDDVGGYDRSYAPNANRTAVAGEDGKK